MRASALQLAATIVSASETAPNPTTIDNMAACISHGNGGFRVEGTRMIWLVLDSLLKAKDASITHPVLVRTGIRVTPRAGSIISTSQVANTFRDSAKPGIGRRNQDFPEGFRNSWAPAATQSDNPIPIGGASGLPVANTIDVIRAGNEFNWYDLEPLADYPIGCLVYRIKARGSIAAYQRLQPQKWLTVTMDRATSPVDVRSILAECGADEIEPTHLDHPRPLLHSIEG